MIDIESSSDFNNDMNNIATVSVYLMDVDATLFFVNYYVGNTMLGFYSITKQNVETLLNSSPPLSTNDYSKLWSWNPSADSSIVNPNPTTSTTTNSVIESRIEGEFDGWDGETIFKLQNGQTWKQSSYAYYYHYAYSPKVTIYKDGSTYKMMVDGVDKKIDVVQIK